MRLDDLSFRLTSLTRSRLAESRAELRHLSGLLSSLGPQAVLDRGYAVVRKGSGVLVRDPGEVQAGESLDIRVAKGSFEAVVTDEDSGHRTQDAPRLSSGQAGRRKK